MIRKNLLRPKGSQLGVPVLMRQLVFSWLLAVTAEILLLPKELRGLASLDGLAAMSFGRVLLITACCTLLLLALSRLLITDAVERIGISVLFSVLAALSLEASFSVPFLLFCLLIFGVLLVFAIRGWNSTAEPQPIPKTEKEHRSYVILASVLAGALFFFISAWTVARYLTFSTPTFDFGIFSQMFYNMKETGLPVTTVERTGALSHFAVHVSPIYYLMLPFYMVFPSPITLQMLQAAVIASAVIPLWKIGRGHGLSAGVRTMLCVILVLFPAVSGGASYDLHENCFLLPLILWLFYAIDRRNTPLTVIFALLVLTVKEDAAMYVAIIGLWLVIKTLLHFRKEETKPLLVGACLLVGALIWFFLVTGYLAAFGDGVMTYRYDNFMYDGSSSLLTVIKSVVLNPMKAMFECVDGEKLSYIGLTMLPLVALPLITRRYERLLLLIPYILVNLMSDYTYQHDVMFQYNFGSTAFLFYLTAVNLADFPLERHRVIPLVTAVAVSAACFATTIFPTAWDYMKRSVEYASYYDGIREALDAIPEGVPATATYTYTSYLSDRAELYDVRRCTWEQVVSTEYVALSRNSASSFEKYATDGKANGFANFTKRLEENGYELVSEASGVLMIYHKIQSNP